MDFVIQWSCYLLAFLGGLGCCLGSRHSVDQARQP